MRYYVEINGESSLDIQGLMIQSLPSISKPLIRSKQETIDGRDGDIITKLGYGAYDKTLKIGLWGNYDINEVIAFFNQEGTITFSNEPDKYYRFTILNREDYVSQLDKFRTATIMIHCQPFKYKLNEEAEEIENEYTTQEGTSLTFNNTLVAPINIDLKGNTSQNGTPTPSSPIPVNVVSGDNEIVVCGKNIFNKQEIVDNEAYLNKSNVSNLSTNESGISWNATANDSYISLPSTITGGYGMYMLVEPSTTYVLSFTTNYELTNYVHYIKEDYTFIERNVSLGHNSGVSFTTPSNCKYIFIRFGCSNQSGKTINITNIQIEQGNQATTYEAYNGTTYNIDLPVENLFDKDTNTNEKILGNDGSEVDSTGFCISDYIAVQPNTTYTISRVYENLPSSEDNMRLGLYTQNKTWIERVFSSNKPYIYTTPSNCYFIRLSYQYTITNTNVQVEKGTKANSYTPYGTTPIELNKIGTYQDYFYKENDKWYLHKEIGKATFNGTENWATSGAAVPSGVSAYSNNTNSGFITNTQGYSNLFTIIDNATDWNVPSGNGTARYTSNQLYIKILTSIAGDVNALKTWLGNNNITMCGILSTPTNTEITYTPLIEQLNTLEQAQSKEGTTNVNQVNNDAPFIITASVLSGTDSITLTNEGNTTSKPTLTITGSGVVGVYLENIQMFNISLGTNETIIIDTENMEAYYGSQLKNRQVTGDYSNFALQSGTNNLKFTGLVTNVEITNYNRWI